MTESNQASAELQFHAKQAGLESVQVWEYDAATKRTSRDAAAETVAALAAPDDFPPLESAIVPGDRAALAVDPNVPQVEHVVAGAIRALKAAGADQIEIVVWDEATDETLNRIRAQAGELPIHHHRSDQRESLCYLAADVDAEPIYLNRALVEADFVLPIIAVRPSNLGRHRDLTGLFPALTDSATRQRFLQWLEASGQLGAEGSKTAGSVRQQTVAEEVPWLLGVQLILSVTANSKGQAGEIHAGTIEAIAKRITPTLRRPDPVPPPAALVVAALDGDQQQQTWENVARAADAALAYAEPDATIVIWTSISEAPSGALLTLDSEPRPSLNDADPDSGLSDSQSEDEQPLPRWDRMTLLSRRLQEVMRKHRVILHSRLDREVVEPLGLGVVESARELANLSRGFESCGVLRAAQFAGGN
jgi:hypothetical protein